jgi:hypothetical protein
VLLRRKSTNAYISCVFIARKLILGLIIRYVFFNITGKIIIRKPNIFTGTRTQDNLRVCNLRSCNFPAETNNFVLGSVLSCLVTELQKPSSPGLKPSTDFEGYGPCPTLAYLKQTILVLTPFFYHPLFPGNRNNPHRDSNLGHFRSFDLSEISSWFQGISMLSLI